MPLRSFLATLALVVIFALPSPASAQTVSDLQAQINALLAQIAALQGETSGTSYALKGVVSEEDPYLVTFTYIMNQGESCSGGRYRLHFGDNGLGQELNYPADACNAYTQHTEHRYENKGTYTATLYETTNYGERELQKTTVTVGIEGKGDSCLVITNTLSLGSTDARTGGDVSRLQKFLGGEVTGFYGVQTMKLVSAWQSAHGIPALGIVGPVTRAAMMASCDGGTTEGESSATIDQSTLRQEFHTGVEIKGTAKNVKTLDVFIVPSGDFGISHSDYEGLDNQMGKDGFFKNGADVRPSGSWTADFGNSYLPEGTSYVLVFDGKTAKLLTRAPLVIDTDDASEEEAQSAIEEAEEAIESAEEAYENAEDRVVPSYLLKDAAGDIEEALDELGDAKEAFDDGDYELALESAQSALGWAESALERLGETTDESGTFDLDLDKTEGVAPLTVRATVTLEETSSSCGAEPIGTIDWGDGKKDYLVAERSGSSCGEYLQDMVAHTYSYAGSFTVLAETRDKELAVQDLVTVTGTTTIPTGTVVTQTYATSFPTLTGTASGVGFVGLTLYQGDKVYGSGKIPVISGRWSHAVTTSLLDGTYDVGLHDYSTNEIIGKGKITVKRERTEFPAPTCVLTASPARITVGGSSTLTWTSTNANYVLVNGEKGAPSGSMTVTPTATKTYGFTAYGPTGGKAGCTTTVTVTTVTTPTVPTVPVEDTVCNWKGVCRLEASAYTALLAAIASIQAQINELR